ncbi:AI-2E family transporter [Candidatus Falkowbacteria bacterium]|nr:AI-2E family transporter [Candidatus Falkowbacteria bacterium]
MSNENKNFEISVSTETLVKIVAMGLLVYVFYLERDILLILFISLVLASALDPWVDWLQKKRVPRPIGILLIYLALFTLLGSAFYFIAPPIAREVAVFGQNFPAYQLKFSQIFSSLQNLFVKTGLLDNFNSSVSSLSGSLSQAAPGILAAVINIFGGIVSSILVLFLTFYMTVEENAIKRLVWLVTPEKNQTYVLELINRMQRKIGLWLRGQMILCLTIFFMVWIVLSILGVKYALVLALIAGITEAIPYIGPTLGALPAIFLSFVQSPLLALFVAISYYIIQMVENNILVPKIMQKTIGLNPIISIVVFIVGLNLGGLAGAILSIPVAAAISVYIADVLANRRGSRDEPEF